MPRFAPSAVVPLFALIASAQQPPSDAKRWAGYEKEIAAIEKRLADTPPPANPTMFVGSSTVRLWDLERSFPGKGYVNAGFGGCQTRDCTHFAPRLIGKAKPGTVVLAVGGNDLNAGRTPEQVRDDYRELLAAVRKYAPDARVVVAGINPSIKRWEQFAAQRKANEYLKGLCAGDPKRTYFDVVPALLGPGGTKPPADLLVKDELHLSPKGYDILAAGVAKALADRP
jgi:lysophospholipase L1-like esterase